MRSAVALFLLSLAMGGPAGTRELRAQDWVGGTVKVVGSTDGGRWVAVSVRHRRQEKDPRVGKITAQIAMVDPSAGRLMVGPLAVVWTSATRFQGMTAEELREGLAVEVAGELAGPRRLIAQRIERASISASGFELSGAVSAMERLSGGARLVTVLGLPVEISHLLLTQGSDLTRSPNSRRPDRQLTVQLFGRPLTVGGELGTTSRLHRGFHLDSDLEDRTILLEQEVQLEFTYPVSPSILLFVTGKGGYESEFASGQRPGAARWDVKRGETWIYLPDIGASGFGLQVGRQNFRESRQWWWGKDLDAARIRYDRSGFHAEVALAEEVAPVSSLESRIDPEAEGVRRWIGQAAWNWVGDQRLDAFAMRQDDHSSQPLTGDQLNADRADPSDAQLSWVGGRASGVLGLGGGGALDYWLDGALVRGEESTYAFTEVGRNRLLVTSRQDRRVDGWALDGGLSWTTPLPARPTFTFGYAHGSGGPASGSTDRAFRQTGLHDNNDRFRGVDRFRYYGELLRPDLSNLNILTAAVGVRVLGASSLEALYHDYDQILPSSRLTGAKLDADPLGLDRDIGKEWDLVLGFEEWEHLEIEIAGSIFRPGPAYGSGAGRTVRSVTAKLNVNF